MPRCRLKDGRQRRAERLDLSGTLVESVGSEPEDGALRWPVLMR